MAKGAASSAVRSQLCVLLLLISSTSVFCQSISSIIMKQWEKERSCNINNNKVALFVFGDSLYDPGNNNYISTTNTNFKANFWPYGKSTFSKPTGRFSDGLLIPDFICKYAGLQVIPPYLQPGNHHYLHGANFASAGAGALNETNPGQVVSLNTQLNQFKNVTNQLKHQLGDEEASVLLARSVYMFSIGVNDYIRTKGDAERYRSMIIGNLTSVVKAIYKTGGRKFSFLTLPDVGCFPGSMMQYGNKSSHKEFSRQDLRAVYQEHNKAISKKLEKLEKQLKGFMYSLFDFYTALNDRTMNPSKYGFKNGNSACCGSGPYRGDGSCGGMRGGIKEYELCKNPDEYVFFDSAHPSEAACHQLSKLMWEGSSSFTRPYNIRSFFESSN